MVCVTVYAAVVCSMAYTSHGDDGTHPQGYVTRAAQIYLGHCEAVGTATRTGLESLGGAMASVIDSLHGRPPAPSPSTISIVVAPQPLSTLCMCVGPRHHRRHNVTHHAWPLRTKRLSSRPRRPRHLPPLELEQRIVSGKRLDTLVDSLAAAAAVDPQKRPVLCMHHVDASRHLGPGDEDLALCTLTRRWPVPGVSVMINPVLEGYSDEGRIVHEQSIFCSADGTTMRKRRLRVAIQYQTLVDRRHRRSAVTAREVLDDPDEAASFQMAMEELDVASNGYACSV